LMVSSPRLAAAAATTPLIAILLLFSAPASLAARRALAENDINGIDNESDPINVAPAPAAEAAKCINADDEIRLAWPERFTPALTSPEQRARAVSPLDRPHARRLLLKLGPLLLGDKEKLIIGTIGGSVTTVGLAPVHDSRHLGPRNQSDTRE
jgi:hypothetical protein